ncbi:pre-mRNA-splicing regulator female-lethal(2)D-like isoform X2 [Nilaparvata lugens]|uniref:pre-mRNA-splicing regulator female-lethal(2)D isoform X2 n=1 Tax=Nilaparvata lugens TaxID=108931 RepID=UPI00193D4B57|nr:pre-mRNA-splicing regulator female-lethal(2)D isoform X2 [Nilaparvata lugens]XP_039277005.1 pre-mRNA-splicing regulator female-lethal(2)D isoform X2 [Nilaparvata lugens]XP_039280781.1 pre-mRNA-splicing regulator female-lethal(2)D-like isoform X2 [Nilaparvata lugens]XP_039280786.1 pre-mRNA-splicing regulator female-lethal(2)D-like isoform X2 [Nilaparvata lugens]
MPRDETEISALRETEEKLKQQHTDLIIREKVLVRRLAAKEQEIQEYAGQLSELKAAQSPSAAALRQALLDPAVNLLLQRLRHELTTTRTRLDETHNELSAWKFTPDSNTGKRLMAKCRLLYQENEELGRMISSGRLAKLEGDLALQKSFSEEVKKSQSEMDEFLQDLDEDVEGMQSTIYYLQQELRKAKDAVVNLEQENSALRTRNSVDSSEKGARSEEQCNNNESLCRVKCEVEEGRTNGVAEPAHNSPPNIHSNNDNQDTDGDNDNQDTDGDNDNESHDNTGNCRTEGNGFAQQLNSNVIVNSRKRTSSEDSDDVPLSKKIKTEPLVHYDDDDVVNGDGSESENNT